MRSKISLRNDVNLCFSVKNPLSDFEVREKVVIDPTDVIEQEENNSKEPACHFAIKWEGSKKRSTLEIYDAAAVKTALKKKKKNKGVCQPREYTGDDDGEWVPVLAVECRGLEPYAFHPMGDEFIVTSSEGDVTFEEDVDFGEGDWADYDAENDAPVSISDFGSKFETV